MFLFPLFFLPEPTSDPNFISVGVFMWTHKGGIFFGKLLRIKLFLHMFFDYLLRVFQTGLIPSTFLPGMAVKAKINLFLCSLAAGMDNIGTTTINTWFCAVLGSVGGSWHWKTMEPKTWI